MAEPSAEEQLPSSELESALTIAELELNAMKFWPQAIAVAQSDASIIPKLIETQEVFIDILTNANADPFAWKLALAASGLSPNLFLKHLMVLSDVGGERLSSVKKELITYFPDGDMKFTWRGSEFTYRFKTLSDKNWTNKTLYVDGKALFNTIPLTERIEDVSNYIMFAGASTAENLPTDVINDCVIGAMLGQRQEVDDFVKQRYIWVSRITGGAKANDLGYLTQDYVKSYLQLKLPKWNFERKTIPGLTQNGRTLMPFDIVAISPTNKYCGIEVSFQVTTNSTIERKANEARDRKELCSAQGHKIAYVIDGAGNFRRVTAIRKIMSNSDCTVTFKDSDLDKLIHFLNSIDPN